MKWKLGKSNTIKRPVEPFSNQLVNMSLTIQTQFLPQATDKSFQTVCLVPLFPLGSIETIFLIMFQNYHGEEVCSQAFGSRSPKLKASWSLLLHQSLNECFAYFLLSAQKALWHSSDLCFLLCFIFDNPLSVRLLARSYNRLYFQGCHFHDKESQF